MPIPVSIRSPKWLSHRSLRGSSPALLAPHRAKGAVASMDSGSATVGRFRPRPVRLQRLGGLSISTPRRARRWRTPDRASRRPGAPWYPAQSPDPAPTPQAPATTARPRSPTHQCDETKTAAHQGPESRTHPDATPHDAPDTTRSDCPDPCAHPATTPAHDAHADASSAHTPDAHTPDPAPKATAPTPPSAPAAYAPTATAPPYCCGVHPFWWTSVKRPV